MLKTIDQILAEIHQERPCSRKQLYRYFEVLGIKPAGARQRPQRYPADTTARILAHLGLAEAPANIVTMKELRAERAKARGAK